MLGLVSPYVPRITPLYNPSVETLPPQIGSLVLTGNRRMKGSLPMVVLTKSLATPIDMPVFAIPFLLTPVLINVLVLGRPTSIESTNVLCCLLRVILCASPEHCLTKGIRFAEARVEPPIGEFPGCMRSRLPFILLCSPTSRIRLLLTCKTVLQELVLLLNFTMK